MTAIVHKSSEQSFVNVNLLFPQYACDLEAEVIGKPSPAFFQSVLNDMGLQPHEVCNKMYA